MNYQRDQVAVLLQSWATNSPPPINISFYFDTMTDGNYKIDMDTFLGVFCFIKQLCTTGMVNAAEALVLDSDFRQSLPWWYGPSWVVPVVEERQNKLYANTKLSAVVSEQPSVPREWTGSEHKRALLPCLTGVHCGTGMEPRVHTEDWTRLRTVRNNLKTTSGSVQLIVLHCQLKHIKKKNLYIIFVFTYKHTFTSLWCLT